MEAYVSTDNKNINWTLFLVTRDCPRRKTAIYSVGYMWWKYEEGTHLLQPAGAASQGSWGLMDGHSSLHHSEAQQDKHPEKRGCRPLGTTALWGRCECELRSHLSTWSLSVWTLDTERYFWPQSRPLAVFCLYVHRMSQYGLVALVLVNQSQITWARSSRNYDTAVF
jgi:hypothetical protein